MKNSHLKRVLGLTCFSVAITTMAPTICNAEQPNANKPYAEWVISYNKAVKQSKQSGRPIMLVFSGSDWCAWCKKLSQEVFTTHEFARWSTDNVIKVEVDFPQTHQLPSELQNQNESLMSQYGDEIQTYPTVLFISPDGQVIGKTGYVAGGPNSWIANAKNFIQPAQKEDLLAAKSPTE